MDMVVKESLAGGWGEERRGSDEDEEEDEVV